MRSRLPGRLFVFGLALVRFILSLGRRKKPLAPKSILIAHHLLLGDTLMLTPLLAHLRARHPEADIVMTMSQNLIDLYRENPYGVCAIAYSPYDIGTLRAITRRPGGFDLALLPGNNRFALLALAAGARWIVAFREDRPGWKNLVCDERIPFPDTLTAVGDLFPLLAGEASAPAQPLPALPVWRPQASAAAPAFEAPYAVLHLGAGNALRRWPAECWTALAEGLHAEGITPLFCGGPGEQALIDAANPDRRFPALLGPNLVQVAGILAGCAVLICLDSGISHLAKLVGNPTLTLYGPGAPELFGPGEHWRQRPFRAISIDAIPCRDQHSLFGRTRPWVQRCNRKPEQCQEDNRCMRGISVERVLAEALALIRQVGDAA